MHAELSLAGIIQGAWLVMCRLWFSSNYTWPIQVKVLEPPIATFVYVGRRCHIKVKVDFHLRVKPVMLKRIWLETDDIERKESIQSFDLQKEYKKLTDDVISEEIFIYDEFAEGKKGHLIVEADNNECLSRWFPIILTNRKDDLLSQEIIERRVRKFKL